MSADPVISDAVWRAYREGVIRSDVYLDPSDRESAGLRAAITQWLAEQQTGPHVYLSTGCYHGRHDYCAAMTGMRGEKRPARCKWCEARCECDCHSCPTCCGPVRETVGMICQTCGTDYSAPAVAGAPEAPDVTDNVIYQQARRGGADHIEAMRLASDPDADWPMH